VKLLITLTIALTFSLTFPASDVRAQDVCPSGQVCIPQETANRLFDVASQLVEAKDVIAKMLAERGASDAAIASAMKTIEGWKNLDEINNTIIAKQRDVIALYERTIQLYAGLVDSLEKRLSKPKSAWSRLVDVLKNAAILLAGISLGRGI
jgi:hypothetical protein